MKVRPGTAYRILREGDFSEFFARALETFAAALRSYQCRLGGRRRIGYDTSAYRAGIFRSPAIRLVASGKTGARLNVILPHIHKTESFAGVRCAMELAYELSGYYSDIRFVSLASINTRDLHDLNAYVQDPADKHIEAIGLSGGEELQCHEHEVFLCTLWRTVVIWEAYADALKRAGFNKNPFYYFIQDFEPGFFPFGSEYAMAHKTYSHKKYTNAIFNSQELPAFFRALSISFDREYIVKPSLDADIFRYLQRSGYTIKPKDKNKINILIYGRHDARNCLSHILEGLYRFFAALPTEERMRYSIVSAGGNIPGITLMPGVVIRSAGKLSMEKYIGELERAHIGISFMESPHPSFPPLEMAVFGIYTITNKFFGKDLSRGNPLIHSIDYPVADELVQALTKAVEHIERPESAVISAAVPDTVSGLSWRENLHTAGIAPIMSANAL